MTEAEWPKCKSPAPLLNALQERGIISERKLRMFACGCCRRVWTHFPKLVREAVELSERYAEGAHAAEATLEQLRKAEQTVTSLRSSVQATWEANLLDVVACHAGLCTLVNLDPEGAWHWSRNVVEVANRSLGKKQARNTADAELPAQASVLRDIFGNPFRPIAFSPSWRTDTVLSLARQMYDSRDFSAMPILADALQDAGCDSEDILTHCRGDGPHVRGCFVVDLILGKS